MDFVIERGQELLAIEVKASSKVTHGDARNLRTFLHEYADVVRGALVLYTGDDVFWPSRDILVLPWWLAV